MERNKYKILVLSDLKNSSSSTLKSTISLAKMIDGSVDFFYVKKPTEIVEKDNQLSANRLINLNQNEIEKKIQNLINPFSKDHNVTINYSYAFGNVKNEIDNYIQKNKPDIIVIGKKKTKVLKFFGDNIANFILNTYPGVVMIADNKNAIEPNQVLSLGLLNDFNTKFMKNILGYTQNPIKSFKIVNNLNAHDNIDVQNDTERVEYVFDYNDNTLKNLPNYLSMNNINLLCVDRGKKKKSTTKFDINTVVKNSNVTLLFSGV